MLSCPAGAGVVCPDGSTCCRLVGFHRRRRTRRRRYPSDATDALWAVIDPLLAEDQGLDAFAEEPPRQVLPTESERAHAVGRDYVAAGLATEFAVEAETLRLTATLYPESLARNVCRKLPTGWQVVVYRPDREQPVAQCDGRIP